MSVCDVVCSVQVRVFPCVQWKCVGVFVCVCSRVCCSAINKVET